MYDVAEVYRKTAVTRCMDAFIVVVQLWINELVIVVFLIVVFYVLVL